MNSYTNILVALDLRKESKKILNKAKAVLADGGKVRLVHIAEPIETGLFASAPYSGNLVSTDDIESATIERKKEKLKQFSEKSGFDNPELYVAIGKASKEIKKLAARWQNDLIVMGTHGQKGLDLLLGSTASGVLHGSPCDVLAVQMRVNAKKS